MFYHELPANRLREKVDEIMDRWRSGDPPNALAVLDELPQLKQHHSLAVDLAYEEYCLREETGEAVDVQEFCQQFGGLRRSLARMLSMHRVLQSHSLGLSAAKTVEWPVVGSHWLDWRLTEEIGRGAFSRVFLAEEPALGNRKIVVKCSTSGPDEAFVLGKLDHPNVMPIHSIRHDESRGLVGICMPFAGRVTLAEIIDQLGAGEPFSDNTLWPKEVGSGQHGANNYTIESLRLIEKVARGLHAAHEAEFLHGDIKPSNILLSFAGEPRLVDFNLADDMKGGQQRLGGTPPYMAPERLPMLMLGGSNAGSGRAKTADLRSDVFSLGVVLFELLYGQTPFEYEVEDLQITYHADSLRGWKSLQNLHSQPVPADVIGILDRAIAFEPEERFASAAQFADELAKCIARHTAVHPRKVSSRSISGILVAGVLIVLAVLFAGGGLWSPHSPEHQALALAIEDIAEEDFVSAVERLRQVAQTHPSQEIYAWLGYCLVEMDSLVPAKAYFQKAEPKTDLSGTLWHNIGCCEAQSRLVSTSISSFDKALELNPYLQKAYEQRAATKMRIATTADIPPVDGMLDDIEAALSLGPDEAHLLFEAAQIYIFTAEHSAEYRENAECFIRRSLEAGVPLKTFDGLEGYDFAKYMPPTPPPAPKRKSIDAFQVPPFDLQALLTRMP